MAVGRRSEHSTKCGISFSVIVWAENPDGSPTDITETEIRAVLQNSKRIVEWALILHDKDEGARRHWHIAIYAPNKLKVAELSRWFEVPESDIKVLGFSRTAFVSYLIYLTHDETSQRLLGKAVYSDDAVTASPGFNWRAAADAMLKLEAIHGKRARGLSDVQNACLLAGDGMELDELKELFPRVFTSDRNVKLVNEALRKRRMSEAEVPQTRINYVIVCDDDRLSFALAQGLAYAHYPDIEQEDEIYFVADRSVLNMKALGKSYMTQPVIIWVGNNQLEVVQRYGADLSQMWSLSPRTNTAFKQANRINIATLCQADFSSTPFSRLTGELNTKYETHPLRVQITVMGNSTTATLSYGEKLSDPNGNEVEAPVGLLELQLSLREAVAVGKGNPSLRRRLLKEQAQDIANEAERYAQQFAEPATNDPILPDCIKDMSEDEIAKFLRPRKIPF